MASRCSASGCKSKLSLVEVACNQCGCGKLFCSKHRMPEDHACPQNFHAKAQEQLANALPQVKAAKVDEI